jgi:hypothetical protein
VSNIAGDSSIIGELSPNPRSMSGIETSTNLTKMFAEEPVTVWNDRLNNMDLPENFFLSFAGIIANVVNLIFPYYATHYIISYFSNLFIGKENSDFIVNIYLPKLR